jgi:hypothetical protein
MEWLLRSPDMTPMDFFLWGFVKDNILCPPAADDITRTQDTNQEGLCKN